VSVLGKATQTIECLARAGEPVRLGAVSAELGLPKSSTHRLLGELADLGIVRRVEEGRYGLGHRLLYWGTLAAESFDLRAIAEPSMRRLRDQFGESVHLHVHQDGARVVIAAAQADHSLRPHLVLGQPLPLGTGAAGKLLLAFVATSTDRDGHRPRKDGLAPHHVPAAELERIRREHWATSVGEVEDGLAAAAASVTGAGDMVVGALSISGSSTRLTPQRLDQLREPLVACADEIGGLIRRG
jgi:IclR family transcriptional regulator, KDG regulon repressor